MLVIISDLHLTDGTSGDTIHSGAFREFRENVRQLAYDASWRGDGRYEPIEQIDVLLLGDILDVIRSTQWCNAPVDVRPWGNQDDPRFADIVRNITSKVIQNNSQSLAILKSLHSPEIMSVPPRAPGGGVATKSAERVHVPVRIYYMVGNHDWFFHLTGPAFDSIRQEVVQALGLENIPTEAFPHDPTESPAIMETYKDHAVFARHGDIFDPSNFEHSRDASSLGDAIVIELLDKFGISVRNQLGSRLPPLCEAGLKEIDNVRPLSLIPVWVDGLLTNTCPPELADEIKDIWNKMVHQFLDLDFVRSRPMGSSILTKLALEISSEVPIVGVSDVAAWFSSKFGGGRGDSLYPYALREKAFLEGWADFIVYGHTHHYEIVPLQSASSDGTRNEKIYINSGTWRPVHELAKFHPVQKQFVGYHVMSYVTFFKNDERKGRAFETWTGALGSSS